ncbi:MAG: hypothetical protein CV087_17615 [Candidatus Brocadia sp. WS118]|nr:MAG: hypothetical protein CV087_17615 [Candidatus Brocadia sp. WS118]
MNQLTQNEAWHIEQRRKSQDLIRVYNPTEEDYVLIWDRERFVVPNKNKDTGYGKGMRVMQRYLAEKFTKEIVDKIILTKQDEKLKELKEKLNKQGAVDIDFHANRQLMGVDQIRSDSPAVRHPLEDIVWLGIEEEFGMDKDLVEEEAVSTTLVDPFERLSGKRYVAPKGEEFAPETPKEEEVASLPVEKKRGRPAKHNLSNVAEEVV